MKQILVLAGNFKESQEYARSQHPRGYVISYVSGVEAMAGRHYDGIEVIGTFWDRPDADKLYKFAKTRVIPAIQRDEKNEK